MMAHASRSGQSGEGVRVALPSRAGGTLQPMVMTTAAIVYCSATWTTAGLAEDIANHLRSKGIETSVAAFGEEDREALASADLVFLGAWTHGLFVVAQHPERAWVEWTAELPRLDRARVALFTTYKLRTGSMFRRMREALAPSGARVELELKSRDRELTAEGRRALDAFLGG
jgi:sulfite reductase alpha subunit-like flavoprotein